MLYPNGFVVVIIFLFRKFLFISVRSISSQWSVAHSGCLILLIDGFVDVGDDGVFVVVIDVVDDGVVDVAL